MAIVPLLERPFCAAYIYFLLCGCLDCCLVYDGFLQAVTIHGALFLLLTVTCLWLWVCAGIGGGQYLAVVCSDYCFHVGCSAVADLDEMSVKYLVQFVSRCENLVNKLEEPFPDVCFDC